MEQRHMAQNIIVKIRALLPARRALQPGGRTRLRQGYAGAGPALVHPRGVIHINYVYHSVQVSGVSGVPNGSSFTDVGV